MNNFLVGKKITVLCSGPNIERKISLRFGAVVSKALRSLDADVSEFDVHDENFHLVSGAGVMFNALPLVEVFVFGCELTVGILRRFTDHQGQLSMERRMISKW
jgi:D-alanine-D-alanine ligase-like ATP-grasp enzyme